ncbi:beta-eliminating lyase-related protein [Shigella flexneri]
MDSARFAQNAYFIQQREPGIRIGRSEIHPRNLQYADTLAMSAKKDAMVPMGGLLRTGYHGFFEAFTPSVLTIGVVQEASPLTVGLKAAPWDSVSAVVCTMAWVIDWLSYPHHADPDLVDGLEAIWRNLPTGGWHAAFVDAGKSAAAHSSRSVPGAGAGPASCIKSLGILCCGNWLLPAGCYPKPVNKLPCPAELLRLTIPRATYTQTHMGFHHRSV